MPEHESLRKRTWAENDFAKAMVGFALLIRPTYAPRLAGTGEAGEARGTGPVPIEFCHHAEKERRTLVATRAAALSKSFQAMAPEYVMEPTEKTAPPPSMGK